MKSRGITEQDVSITLYHPNSTSRTPEPSVCYTRLMSSGRSLKVWIVEEPTGPLDPFIVKSAAWKGEADE